MHWRRLILLLMALPLCTPLLAQPAGDPPPRERLTQVNQAINDIRQWLSTSAESLGEQERTLRRVQGEIREQEETLAEDRLRAHELEQQLERLEGQAHDLEAEIENGRDQVARALRASWMSRDGSPLKLLLNQQDPARGQRMLVYQRAFNRARLTHIAQWREQLRELERTQQEITERDRELEQQMQSIRDQLMALEAERQRSRRLIADLQDEMATRHDTLEALEQDREQLEALIEEINRIVVDIPGPGEAVPFSESRGEMPWPVSGRPANRFGEPYSNGNLQRQGIIIAGPAGEPVRAVHQGRVVFADWLRGSGLLVVVDHGDGYLSLYARNEALDKRSGQWVNRGEPLATAGNNAGAGRSGIYFEIRRNGTPLDPLDWLQPR